MTKAVRILLGTGGAALAIAAATLPSAEAQPSATVTPPARADVALRGNVLATRNVGTPAACLSECRGTPGCTGYSLNRAAKATCSLLGGALTDIPVKGAVSCRMPCDLEPRKPALQQRLPGAPEVLMRQPAADAGTGSTQSASFGTGPVPYTPLPACVPGRVAQVGTCSNAAVPATPAAPAGTTVTLAPINDNTIASSSLSATYEGSVYQANYWFPSTPGIGMGCDQLFVALTGGQHLSCARGLIKFNLASLAGKTIQSATLKLTTSASGVGSNKDPWYVAASASPWSGSTVTWLNYGEQFYVPSVSNQNAPTSAGQVYNIDETSTVRSWVSGSYANNGFAMALKQEQLRNCSCISLDHFEFHSNEDPGGRGPKLIVTYQ